MCSSDGLFRVRIGLPWVLKRNMKEVGPAKGLSIRLRVAGCRVLGFRAIGPAVCIVVPVLCCGLFKIEIMKPRKAIEMDARSPSSCNPVEADRPLKRTLIKMKSIGRLKTL